MEIPGGCGSSKAKIFKGKYETGVAIWGWGFKPKKLSEGEVWTFSAKTHYSKTKKNPAIVLAKLLRLMFSIDPLCKQEDAVSVVHIVGALLVFVGGILYCWVQSFISYKMKTCGLITNTLFILRVFIAIAVLIFFITCVTATLYASKNGVRYHLNSSAIVHRWDPKDKNYIHHVIGDVSEWLTALTLLGFMFTYFGEFRFIKMKIVVSRRTHNPVPLATGMSSEDSLYSLYV